MGTVDRVIRSLIAIIVIALYFTNQITGITAIILLIFAGVFLFTSFISSCPMYSVFGISTKKKES